MKELLYVLDSDTFLLKTYNEIGHPFFVKLDKTSKIKVKNIKNINMKPSSNKLTIDDEFKLQEDYDNLNHDIVHENLNIKNNNKVLTLIQKNENTLLLEYNSYYEKEENSDFSLPYLVFSEYQFINYFDDINQIIKSSFLNSRNLIYEKVSFNAYENLYLLDEYIKCYENILEEYEKQIKKSKNVLKYDEKDLEVKIENNYKIEKLLAIGKFLSDDLELYENSIKKINKVNVLIKNL